MNRFQSAHLIQQGACNPAGVARALVKAIDEARAECGDTDSICNDVACRLICHQLAFLFNLEFGYNSQDYSRDVAICEEKAKVEG